mgnify:FL=1
MARPAGIVVRDLYLEKPDDISGRTWDRAARSVAGELEDRTKRLCSRLNPTKTNPSKPGEYPKLVTGQFVDGVQVVYSKQGGGLRAYSGTMHGVYLEDPARTRPNGRREWATKAFEAKDWQKRVEQVARVFAKK